MSWVRIDDELPGHPKLASLSTDACWLHICGLAHCSRYLTDGIVATDVVPALMGARKTARATKALADKLVAVGLWHRHRDGYEINDYLEFNPSREQVLAKRAKARERIAKFRGSNASGNGVTAREPADEYAAGNAAPRPHAPGPNPKDSGSELTDVESVSNDPSPHENEGRVLKAIENLADSKAMGA